MGFRSMRPRRTRRAAGAAALVIAALAFAPSAGAQSVEELQAARELFQDAYTDEQAGRYAEALDKFQRVATVKETPSIRYRIATVLAAMGRLRESRDIFRAVAASKASLPPSEHEIADSAAEKSAELDQRIPKLALRLEDGSPADVRVTLDGAPIPVSTTARPIELDPGDHVVVATAPGSAQYEQTVTLADGGGEVEHTIALTPEEPAPETPAPEAAPGAGSTLGWVAVGGGAALFVTGAALLIAREGAISEMNAACPNGTCPSSRRSDVEGDRDRAELFGPLGGAMALVGLAAAGAGTYLLVRSSRSTQAASISVAPTLGGARLALTF